MIEPSFTHEGYAFSIQNPERIKELCDVQGISPPAFFATVWSILLQCYTSSEAVTLAVGGALPISDAQPCNAHWQFAITPGTTLAALYHQANQKTCQEIDPVTPPKHGLWIASSSKKNSPDPRHLFQQVELGLLVEADVNYAKMEMWLFDNTANHQTHFMASAFMHLIEQALKSDPEEAVGQLQLLSDADLATAVEWNKKGHLPSKHQSITQLICQRVKHDPSHLAIDAWDGQLSYAQLENLTTDIATDLRKRGVGQDCLVPVCIEKSLWAVVAEISVLKAQGAFVPMDPSQPASWWKSTVKETQAKVVIGSAKQYSALFSAELGVKVVVLSPETFSIPPHDRQNNGPQPNSIIPPANPESTAYVLFTSGSTSKPKGCLMNHQALADIIRHNEALRISPASRVLQFSSYTFAVSLIEIYCTLTAGGTVCIPSDEDRMNNLADYFKNTSINWALMTPSTANSLTGPCVVPTLQTLLLAGEPMGQRHVDIWADGLSLHQCYGLSEWSGICAVTPRICPKVDLHSVGLIPTTPNLWLVDPNDHQRLAPIGAIAELLIEGPSITKGYLNNPQKTAAALVDLPRWLQGARNKPQEVSSTKLYKTGDLVQYLPNGSIRYIARKDTQAKIRGKRVELSEVEHAVGECCSSSNINRVVAEAVVPRDADGTPILAVFLHYKQDGNQSNERKGGSMFLRTKQLLSDAESLRAHLPNVLPDHMVPSVYIGLEYLPLTITGKIDRRELRSSAKAFTRMELAAFCANEIAIKVVRPTEPLQITLHALFSSVLGIHTDSFGTHHSFLRLGGDSIKAMRLAQACRPYGLYLTVADILQAETISNLVPLAHQVSTMAEENVADQPKSVPVNKRYFEGIGKIEEVYACSPIQEGISLSQAQNPDYYRLRMVWVVQPAQKGCNVDIEQLKKACNQLIELHPMLRTIIEMGADLDGCAVQITLPKDTEKYVHILHHHSVDPQDLAAAAPRGEHDASPPTRDLPILSIHASKTGSVFLTLDVNHTVIDGFSMSIIARDLECLYDGLKSASIPSAAHSKYIGYVAAQRRRSAKTALKFWHDYLHGLSPCLLPSSKGQDSKKGQWRSLSIDLGDARRYHEFSKKTGITLATVFKLAWSLVLRSFAVTNDVCFGYMTSARGVPVPGIEDAVGPFIDMVVCRVEIDTQFTFLRALQHVQSKFIESLAHQHVSLVDVRASLGLTHNDLMFNTSLTFPPDFDATEESSVRITQAALHDPTEFDIMVEVRSNNEKVLATFKHWTHKVPRQEVERLSRAMAVAIGHILDDESKVIQDAQVLDPTDLSIMADRSASLPGPSQLSVNDLIEYQVLTRLTADAVCSWDGKFSFQELGDYSTRFARLLVSLGVGPDVFVPLCLHRSRWTPVAMLAVIKAGGAFVLLDDSYPVQRLRDIVDQLSHPGFVIALPESASIAAQLTSVVHLVGDEPSATWPVADVPSYSLPKVEPSTALYAVFTSGSTGKPKGIVVEHGSYAQNTLIHTQHFAVTNPRVLQFSGYSFDVSIFEHLTILTAGGCLCIPSEADRLNRLVQVVLDMKVNSMFLTPSVARTIVPSDVPDVKTLGFVGEAMNQQDVELWSPFVRLTNWYGPAECTVFCGIQPSMEGLDSRNIGWPEGCSFWVTHPEDPNQLLPVGAVGELLVQGPVVSRGYINNPEKNAAAFIMPPSWLSLFPDSKPGPSERVYRTGDLVQCSPDGSYIYLGRKDTQVKLRGHRLEVTEVEHHVRTSFDGATDVVAEVFRPEGASNQPLLVVFVGCQAPRADELSTSLLGPWDDSQFKKMVAVTRSRLQDKLPSYMLPNIFFPLSQVPISRSGKTERLRLRQALMSLSSNELDLYSQTQTVKVAPSSEMELLLQSLFARVLNMELAQVGVHDDFFRLRGDSIAAMRLVAAARQDNLVFTVADVFNHPALCDLAKIARPITAKESSLDSSISSSITPFSLLPKENHRQEKIWEQALSISGLDKDKVENIYPTTALQEGLMALTAQQTAMYTVQLTLSITSGADLGRLKDAWQSVLDSNPILRTRIVPTIEGSMQVVAKPETILWTEITKPYFSSLDEYLADDLANPMSFGQPLVRFAVTSFSDHHHGIDKNETSSPTSEMIILTMHHAIHDRWSISHLLQQVDDAYSGLQLPYRDFSPFIRYLLDQDEEVVRDFWSSEFKGLEMAEFPPSNPSILKGKQEVSRASVCCTCRIDLPQNSGYTVSTLIRLAWAIVVSAHTQSDDVVFGLTVLGRGAAVAQIDEMTGPTVATVPFRVSVKATDTVEMTLAAIQHHVTDLMKYEQTGIQNIRKMGPEAATACEFRSHLGIQPPLSNNSQSSAPPVLSLPSSATDYTLYASYPLLIVCGLPDDNDAMDIQINFDTSILSETQATRIMSQFVHVLRQIWSTQTNSISEIEVLGDHDMAQLRSWNSFMPAVTDSTVHDMVLQHCQKKPDHIAISTSQETVSFAALSWMSERLAEKLIALGVQETSIVALCFEKSIWPVIAMMGILRAGATCVNIDPTLPVSRVHQMLVTTKSQFALVSPSRKQHLKECSPCPMQVLPLSQLSDVVPSPDKARSLPMVTPNHPAFIIFTSGSTGNPKGIIMEHQNLCTSIDHHGPAVLLDNDSRVLHFASYAFDISVYEVFSTLARGGSVCIPTEHERTNDLVGFINRQNINWAVMTPSAVKLLNPEDVPSLRTVLLGGESLTYDNVRAWSHRKLVHGYGPAETTICTVGEIEASEDWVIGTIGPMLGGVGWVTSPSNPGQLLPLGAVGELLIEGPVVTRGYLNQPELTEKAYITAPSWLQRFRHPAQAGRLYRSGDLVQMVENGWIRYMGRKDTQVKVRGQRVELGEIEYHLRARFPGDQEVVAEVVRRGPSTILVAFICPSRSTALDDEIPDEESEILASPSANFQSQAFSACEELKALLPPYMVPAVLLPLRRLPLTKTLKTDRKALREEVTRLSIEAFSKYEGTYERTNNHQDRCSRREPLTEVETTLQQIWSIVLNIPCDHIGLDDTFHSLGGESISAMQVVARCRSSGLVVTVADILRSKTISVLGKCVKNVGTTTAMANVEENDPQGQFQLSPIQKMFFEVAPQGHNHFNQSFLLRLTRPVDPSNMARAIGSIVKQHPMLRARFSRGRDGQWTQEVVKNDSSPSLSFNSHIVHSRLEADAVCLQSQTLLNINDGPLMAVDMISVDQEGLFLHLVAHHLVIDFVSWRIIFQDLEDLLSYGKTTGVNSTSFHAWSEAQAVYAAKALSPEISLPCYSPENVKVEQFWGVSSSDNTYDKITQQSFKLSPQVTSLLFGEANNAFDTKAVELFQASILYAFVQTFTDRPAPAIFTEGHGREPWDNTVDLTRTVGWFTTMWPVHVPLTHNNDLLESVRQTKDARRRVPANGWQYFASRYHNSEGRSKFRRDEPIEILFNYVGLYQQLQRHDSLLQLEEKDHLPDVAGDLKRFALVDISASVVDSCLTYTFFINRCMKHQDSLAAWVQRTASSLQEASEKLVGLKPQYTLSSFPMLPSLTYSDLDWFTHHTIPNLGLRNCEVEDIYPCSPVQQGILLSQAKDPHQYLDVAIWKISLASGQAVDIPRLLKAWQHVVDRHPILRTLFLPVADRNCPDQVVLRGLQADIEICEPSTVSKPRSFSGTDPVNSRHKLFITKETDGSVRMELLISHSLIDGGSNPIIQRDLSLAYDGKLSSDIPPVYRNYMSYLRDQTLQQHSSKLYWQEYVKDLEPCLFPNLRDPNNGNKNDSLLGGTEAVVASLNLAEDVQAFCKTHGLTATNIVHISWALVLRCFTGTDDVCFGYLTSGRDIPIECVEDAVGPFFNLLVRRVHVPHTSTILSALTSTQDSLLDNLTNQHYPLADLYHAQGMAGQSLFNTLVSVQPFRTDKPSSNLIMEHEGGHDPTEYCLTLSFQLRNDCVRINLDYNTLSFTECQANVVLQSFCQALSHVVGSSSMQIAQASLLDSNSRTKISKWNGNGIVVEERCVSDMILYQCEKQPDRPAICAWDGSLTYGQLNHLSNGLAGKLQSLGVGPNVFVPLCLEKSWLTPVAILATLKAGGAFVLLDVSLPHSRLQSICETLQANVIISSETTTLLARQLAKEVVTVPQIAKLLDQEDRYAQSWTRCSSAGPRDAAYVVFTSGSTGKPKGAVIENWSFCTQISGQKDLLHLNSQSRVLQFSGYTFDVAVIDQLSALIVGGCICIPSEEGRRNNLAMAVQDLHANWALFTPSVSRALDPADFPSLQTVCLAGEAVRESDIALWSGINCIGGYGPAECALVITVQSPLIVDDPRRIGVSQRGRTWVVDTHNASTLLPVGAIGELLVEAPFVSRGYLADPEKTREVFIDPPAWRAQFPMSNQPYRFYKTGDSVKYLDDGSLRYVGRKDSQVKLRGQRIELGEIDTCLNQCMPSLKASAVSVVTLSDSSAPILVAFLHLDSIEISQGNINGSTILPPSVEFSLSIAGLKQQLGQVLPSYMVPSAFLPVSAIPLSQNGKTDLRRLHAEVSNLTRGEIQMHTSSVAAKAVRSPCSENETILRRLLAKALSLQDEESISLEDNFFSIGGDSLTAMRLVSLASKESLHLSITDIFQNPVLSDLAATIQVFNKPIDGPSEPFSLLTCDVVKDVMDLAVDACSITRDDIEDIYPCSPRQEDHFVISEERPGMYMAQYEYEVPQTLTSDKLRAIWQAVLNRNPILRTRIIHTLAGTTVQIVEKARPINWRYDTCLERYLKRDISQIMSLGQPLARFALVKEPDTSYFVLTFHHALYDGWSIPLLMQHAEAEYRGRTFRVEPFTSFIRYITSLNMQAAKAFWSAEFKCHKAVPFPDLRNATTSSKMDEYDNLNREIEIPTLAHPNITVVNVIQLAWSVVVSAYTDSEDVIFGLTTSGRDAPVPNIELMTGPTFAMAPCKVRICPSQSIQDALLSVQRTAAETVAFKHTGLQAICHMGPDTKRACAFNTHLIFHATQDEASDEPKLFQRRATAAPNIAGFTRVPLLVNFFMPLKGNVVDMQVAFDPHVLSKQEICRFLSQVEHVFQQICAGTVQSINEIQLVSPEDMRKLEELNTLPPASRTPPGSDLFDPLPIGDQGYFTDSVAWVTIPSNPSRLAPLGAIGELLTESPVMDEVSLNDFGMTPGALIDSPEWLHQFRAPGTARRVRRTGDLVRVDVDGSIKLIGRENTKRHLGRWIDLAKVEHTVQRHLKTGQQVVADIVSFRGQEQSECTNLVAFVECNDDDPTSNVDLNQCSNSESSFEFSGDPQFLSQMSILRAGLRTCLPSFMIPDLFVPTRTIPLTPSGRVNYNVLQQAASHLNLQEFVPTIPREAPLTKNEQHVHQLVVETLGLPSNDIGMQDNFFDLGGDVFKAMLLSTKARLSGLSITTADIHDHPVLRDLAGLCVT